MHCAKNAIALAISIALLCALPSAECFAETQEGTLLIHGVQPNGSCEWVTLFNHSRTDIFLSEYTLSDGEGTVSFSPDATVPAKSCLTIYSSKPPKWAPDGPSIIDGKGVTFSNFRLADAGDQVMLLLGEVVIDAFVYGNTKTCEGWEGEPFSKIPKNGYANRHSPFDTDSAADWEITVPGRGDFNLDVTYDVDVVPFSFPESKGEPVAQAISFAREEILVSTYVFTHPGLASLLVDALHRGISVSILMENSPAGGIPDKSLSILSTLSDSGAEIIMMDRSEGFGRFQYIHCKYAVIDDKYVVITSENWTESSFSKNRGWGILVDSEEYAGLMRDVFISDSSLENADVSPFPGEHEVVAPIELEPWSQPPMELDWHVAYLQPVLSPDNSGAMMETFLTSAETRIYSQQLSFSKWWMSTEDSPAGWMSQASEFGADARLLVDNSFNDDNGFSLRESAQTMNEIGIEMRFSHKLEEGGVTHNKGIVVDDSVWIGSVNWTWNSLYNNRETAVIVYSKSVSDFFSDLFLEDWNSAIDTESLVRVECSGTMKEGSKFALRLAGADDVECIWNIGGNVLVGNPILVKLDAGEYECSVITSDSESIEFALNVEGQDDHQFNPFWAFVPFAGITLCALLFKRKGKTG